MHSIKGLGASLLQDHQTSIFLPARHQLRSQRGYVAIESGSLAVAWAMEKFQHFLYASHFILEPRSEVHIIHLVKKHQSSHPKIAKDPDKKLSLSFYCDILSWTYKPTG